METRPLIWSIIAATGVVDALLLLCQGMSVSVPWRTIFGGMFLLGLSLAYRRRSRYIASISHSAAQLVVFSYAGAILTYGAMAASPFPRADVLLSRADAALGFSWLAWFQFVSAHPSLHMLLLVAYASIPLQGLAAVGFFAYKCPRRVFELILSGMLSLFICTAIMFFLPAVGAWSQHGIGLVEPWQADFLALRAHTLPVIGKPQGIVAFPSFHAALGVVFIWLARGRKWQLPVYALNALMLVSVMTEGAHYGVDLLSGIAVAMAAIAISETLLKWSYSEELRMSGDRERQIDRNA